MEGLRITFHLATPMVDPSHPIHLDAVLAWAAVQEADGDLDAQGRLPLARYEPDGAPWCWRASRILPRVLLRDTLPISRPFEPWAWAQDRDVRYAGGPKRLTGGTGPYKSYQLRHPLIQVDGAVAWAVGERDRLEALLARVHHLGKLGRIGCGEIIRTSVEPDARADELWSYRTLPVPEAGYREVVASVRPPYWQRTARARAWEPPAAPAGLLRVLD